VATKDALMQVITGLNALEAMSQVSQVLCILQSVGNEQGDRLD
jgi:hypothetical protein